MSVFEVVSGGDRRSLIKRFERKSKRDAISELVDFHLLNCTRIEKLEAEAQALRERLTFAEDAAAKGDDARAQCGGMEMEIQALREEVADLRARAVAVVVPERKDRATTIAGLSYDRGWNACIDELARLNGKTVSMADIRDCLDAELREWTGDHRQAVEVALTDAHGRIHALLESTQDGAAHKG